MQTKTEILKVRLSPELLAQAKALAEKDDMPVSQLVRRWMKEKLEEEPARRKTDKDKTHSS